MCIYMFSIYIIRPIKKFRITTNTYVHILLYMPYMYMHIYIYIYVLHEEVTALGATRANQWSRSLYGYPLIGKALSPAPPFKVGKVWTTPKKEIVGSPLFNNEPVRPSFFASGPFPVR